LMFALAMGTSGGSTYVTLRPVHGNLTD